MCYWNVRWPYAARWLLNGEPLPSSPRFSLVNSTLSQSALLIRNVSRNLNDYRFSCMSPAKMYMVHFRIRFNNASAIQKVSLLMMAAGILCATVWQSKNGEVYLSTLERRTFVKVFWYKFAKRSYFYKYKALRRSYFVFFCLVNLVEFTT